MKKIILGAVAALALAGCGEKVASVREAQEAIRFLSSDPDSVMFRDVRFNDDFVCGYVNMKLANDPAILPGDPVPERTGAVPFFVTRADTSDLLVNTYVNHGVTENVHFDAIWKACWVEGERTA